MYAVAMDSDTILYYTIITILISLPTGTKIYNWICTLIGNKLYLINTNIYLINIFIIVFTLGGITGVILGNGGVDIILHDTYYIVAHFHFVLSLGAVTSILNGIIYYSIKYLYYNYYIYSIISISISILILYGFLLTFTPMHILGFNIMVRRIPDYPNIYYTWNYIISIGSGITLLSGIMVDQ